jgi:hypothetical protein
MSKQFPVMVFVHSKPCFVNCIVSDGLPFAQLIIILIELICVAHIIITTSS